MVPCMIKEALCCRKFWLTRFMSHVSIVQIETPATTGLGRALHTRHAHG